MNRIKRAAALVPGTLLALLLCAAEARAQAAVCTPTQTVSAEADANGVYTTTLVCADTDAAEGAADYRQLHYNHGAAQGANPADRDTTLANNDANNHLSLTIGSGVVFTADGYNDNRLTITDAAILLWHAGAKTVVVENGAVINLERTPTYWSATDPDRPTSATAEYDPAWYPSWRNVLDGLTAIAAHSNTGDGDADVAIRLDGVINVDIAFGGTYAKPGLSDPYRTSGGRAIDVQVKDNTASTAARADLDVLIELGATGAIRHVEGTFGLNGIYAENFSEAGDIRIDLAEGSVIDVSKGGGYGVLVYLSADAANNNGNREGDVIINAAGTIRSAVRSRVWGLQNGIGIFVNGGMHDGRVRLTSSGTIETSQAPAIDARAWRSANARSDDPDTPEIEGNFVDVAAGTVETRGNTAIYASTGSVNADMTVRVAEGASVRARALTAEDYENGAITQERLGASGKSFIVSSTYRYYGWRETQVERTDENGMTVMVNGLEPIITAIAVRDFSSAANAEGVRDKVLVHGTVEAIGGKAHVDPAIWMEGGGRIVVGPTGRVSADSGLAIEGGCVSGYLASNCESKPARNLDVVVAGTVEGDIRLSDDAEGDLTVTVMEGGTVTGTIHSPTTPMTVRGSVGRILLEEGGEVTIPASGRITGAEGEALRADAGDLSVAVAGTVTGLVRSVAGDLTATVSGTVDGDVRSEGGELRLTTAAGSVITGTVHNPVGPVMVPGSIGRILLTNGGEVTVPASGKLTGVEVDGGREALRSETGDLTTRISGTVEGNIEGLGEGDHTVTVYRGGVVTGTIHLAASVVTVHGTVGSVRFDAGGTVTVGPTGVIRGVSGSTVSNAAGDLAVAIHIASGERPDEAAARVRGRIEGSPDGETTVTLVGPDGTAIRPGAIGSKNATPSGPYDVGVSASPSGGIVVSHAFAPRARVYEALPSVLLGMSALPTRVERMAASRSASGVWAHVEGAGGDWKADESETDVEYDVKRYGVRVGVDSGLGAGGLLGFSAHHKRGAADVKEGGEIEVSGNGLGVSASWTPGGGFYLDSQAEATWYEANLESDLRGKLASGASGFGWAAGVEAGRRMESAGLLFTPSARLARASVSMDKFTDPMGSTVEIEDGDRFTGAVGLRVEKETGAGRLFASAAYEHDFSAETIVDVSGVSLETEGEASRALLGVGGVHTWGAGRYHLRGSVNYAASGDSHEIGGGVSFRVRF